VIENETSIENKPYGKLPATGAGRGRSNEPLFFKNLSMNRIFLGVVVLVVVLLAGGVVFLGTYQQPPQTSKMEVQIPNDRLTLQ
jgi:fumarate reductase subunit D